MSESFLIEHLQIDNKEYWDTNWNEYARNEQSKYFATILGAMLPQWFIEETNDNHDDICDLGCAEGDALTIFRKIFPKSQIYGEDFSEKAIEEANKKNPDFKFKVSNILNPELGSKYPVVICSNAVEHFADTEDVLTKICERATKYAIILIPYHEKVEDFPEHKRIFTMKDIPITISDNYLAYAKSLNGDSDYYPYKQLLLVYSKSRKNIFLSDLAENISADRDLEIIKHIDILKQELSEIQQNQGRMEEYILEAQELSVHFATGKLMRLNHLLFRIKGQLLKGFKEDRREFWRWFMGKAKKINRTIGEGVNYNPWMIINSKLNEALSCLQGHLMESVSENMLNDSNGTINHKMLRQEYSKFDVIILSVIDFDFRFQRPQQFAVRFAEAGHRVFYANANFIRPDMVTNNKENLYVIDFASNNCNAIYELNGIADLDWMKQKLDNLISRYAVRDAVVIVDYPNWVYGAEYIRRKYGYKIITDYMDDYTGFIGTAEDFLKDNCIRLLQESDLVIASSQFLYEVASKYTDTKNIEIVRNGTEVAHFYPSITMPKETKKRKVVGYYGAVSHWFDWDKACYLAKAMPKVDIVIVGEVTEHRSKLEKYKNIKLLGEKPYSDLPRYLAGFDVCLIPFDTSTDLIKATNPVKFYEYLSAGKKIVATEIPELLPYKDKFVYMSNDSRQFAEYVKLCLDDSDALQGVEASIEFAKENDWQKRFECFMKACIRKIPKVSIIVLTYNNFVLNKQCIEGILNQTAYGNYELIVVDNHSTDETVDYLQGLFKENHPNVKIVFNPENSGFVGGNIIGLKEAEGEFILLLNNDTLVCRGWITNLVKHLVNNSQYGMCGAVTNAIGNEAKIRVNYNSKESLVRFAYIYTQQHMNEEYTEVNYLAMFCTLIRKEIIDEYGFLDPQYKIGMFEDDDYAELVRKAGYSLVIAEDVFIHHTNNASFKKMNDEEYRDIFEHNKKIFERKWGRKWVMPKYREGVTKYTNTNCTIKFS